MLTLLVFPQVLQVLRIQFGVLLLECRGMDLNALGACPVRAGRKAGEGQQGRAGEGRDGQAEAVPGAAGGRFISRPNEIGYKLFVINVL